MMKKTLIVINNLSCGGAQKSLISLLNSIKSNEIDIDLLVLNQEEMFFTQIPKWVNCLVPVQEIKGMYVSLKDCLKIKLPFAVFIKVIWTKIIFKLRYDTQCNTVQNLWKTWKSYIPVQKENYDLAISYVDGFSNYYVIDKVKAKRKILWVHNEYEKLSYNAEYDRSYFAEADELVTISELCVKSLNNTFPEYVQKIHMLYNLSSSTMIWSLAKQRIPKEYKGCQNVIISIGRLTEQKGFDLGVEAAEIMKAYGQNFNWFIIGEGEEEIKLKEQIRRAGLNEQVRFLGVRKNPYPYILFADIFVQPSRYEGKSIVLDEAKILERPIIVTNYETVYDSISNGNNGMIVDFNARLLAEAIIKLLVNRDICERYSAVLKRENKEKKQEVRDYMDLFYKS